MSYNTVTSDATREQILAALAARINAPQQGWAEWQIKQNCTAARADIEAELTGRRDGVYHHVKVSLTELRRMAKAGLVIETTTPGAHGRYARFTTPEVWAAVKIELGLSDAERAERTAAAVAGVYERNRRERPDSLAQHPANPSYGGWPKDGLAAAVEAGLIRKTRDGYLPESMADAWQQAYDDEQARIAARRAHIKARADRFIELCPPTGQANAGVTLDLGQVEFLIDKLFTAATMEGIEWEGRVAP